YRFAWSESFKRGFKKASRNNPLLRQKLFDALGILCMDPFSPSLKSHKLHGKLEGLWACRADYDCRIVFSFEMDQDSGDDLIVLIDVGKHDEVY
ncbi:MAG: type II toxin-antitoxin system mRNA interferase toxin, RelE/StbE family, partial [Deltaproteobacteria bacterium]|nr:type II toxin-antitoxin system mRNA interferase toxin, RelE/StbE family [Deltaproteobacteria bacterium]